MQRQREVDTDMREEEEGEADSNREPGSLNRDQNKGAD